MAIIVNKSQKEQGNLGLHCTKNQRITPNIHTLYVCMAV